MTKNNEKFCREYAEKKKFDLQWLMRNDHILLQF